MDFHIRSHNTHKDRASNLLTALYSASLDRKRRTFEGDLFFTYTLRNSLVNYSAANDALDSSGIYAIP